jgi:hypothetical protein
MITNDLKIDTIKLVGAIAANAEEIRLIKKVLRTRWPEGQDMAPTQWELLKLQARATGLCVLRARMRGRYHLTIAPRSYRDSGTTWDQERYHAKIAERLAEEFRAAEPVPVALAG